MSCPWPRRAPDTRIVLAGYSQVAVAVHDAENYLAVNKPDAFSQVAGTLLLGDPDRVQRTRAKGFGTATGTAEGLRIFLHLVKARDVPDPSTTLATVASIASRPFVPGRRSVLWATWAPQATFAQWTLTT
jgi:hypothetical protein